jgi:hypothetical protein
VTSDPVLIAYAELFSFQTETLGKFKLLKENRPRNVAM